MKAPQNHLAAAMGNLGHPEVQQAVEHGIGRILAAGRAPSILTADERLARRYLELGSLFVAVGTDASRLARSARALRDRFSPDTGGQPATNEAASSVY